MCGRCRGNPAGLIELDTKIGILYVDFRKMGICLVHLLVAIIVAVSGDSVLDLKNFVPGYPICSRIEPNGHGRVIDELSVKRAANLLGIPRTATIEV